MNARQTCEKLLSSVGLPAFVELENTETCPRVDDPFAKARAEVLACPDFAKLHAGDTVALTAGSREISNITFILKGVISALKSKGAQPFIVPAMGSHGGATAEGQTKMLEHFGITEESMGVPIRSCMDTVEIGRTEDGYPVHLDRLATEADWILPIGRVKPHTDFRGSVESGVMKMLAIGLGKQFGASLCHKLGFPRMGESVWKFGQTILQNTHILMGMAVVENADHDTAHIEAIPAAKIPEREKELLVYARELMPRIPVDSIDLLVVSEVGKDISGAGMDPNITGRSCTLGEFWPHAEKITVFDLTEVSKGNAAGIGNADAITRRMANKIDTLPMYINSITCRDSMGMRIPVIMETEELAIKYLLYTCIRRDAVPSPRIVWIRNTAHLRKMWVSEALMDEIRALPNYRILSQPVVPNVDADGNLLLWSDEHENPQY